MAIIAGVFSFLARHCRILLNSPVLALGLLCAARLLDAAEHGIESQRASRRTQSGDTKHATVEDAPSSKLQLVFSSFRDRPAFASLYVYEHDGKDQGKIVFAFPQIADTSNTQASLTTRGELCLFTAKQVGGFGPMVQLIDLKQRRLVSEPPFNQTFAARTDVVMSADGRWIAMAALDQPGQPGGWDVLLFDRKEEQFIELPGLNSEFNERDVAISGDGSRLAFVSDRSGNAGLSDVFVYDRNIGRLLDMGEINTARRELNPALSSDGTALAFVSDRPGGAGGKDIYLAKLPASMSKGISAAARESGNEKPQLKELHTSVNSAGHEQTPHFGPNDRHLVFISERTSGLGERDIYLYDMIEQRLLPTPGLNSSTEDFDSALSLIPDPP